MAFQEKPSSKPPSRPSSRSSTRSHEIPVASASSSRSDLLASGRTRLAAASQLTAREKAAGDSQMVSVEPLMAAGGSQRAAGDSQLRGAERTPKAAGAEENTETPRRPPSRKPKILSATVQRISSRFNELKISRKPEGTEQLDSLRVEGHKLSQPGTSGAKKSPRRSAGPGGENLNAENLVLSAIGELKSSRKGYSLMTINRHIAAKLGSRAAHWRPYIRNYLRKALKAGKFVHVKGKGLSGTIKVAPKEPNKEVKRRKKPTKTETGPKRSPKKMLNAKMSPKRPLKPKTSPKMSTAARTSRKMSTAARTSPKMSTAARTSPKKSSKVNKAKPRTRQPQRRSHQTSVRIK